MIESVKDNYVDNSVLHYAQRLVEATQEDEDTSIGKSGGKEKYSGNVSILKKSTTDRKSVV